MEIFSDISEVVVIKNWDESTKLDFELYPSKIIVDEACGAAVLRGAHVYVPGIIGMPHGNSKIFTFLFMFMLIYYTYKHILLTR